MLKTSFSMRNFFSLAMSVVVLGAFTMMSSTAMAPMKDTKKVYDADFGSVYKAVKSAIGATGCLLEKDVAKEGADGLFKGKVASTFCVLYSGVDSADFWMDKYAHKVPNVRAATWSSLRVQYTFYLQENEEGMTELKLQTELSGFEEYITSKFHFFDSNGILDEEIMASIDAFVEQYENE